MKGLENLTSEGVFFLLDLGRLRIQWNCNRGVD